MRKRADQTRRRAAPEQEETGTDHAPMLSREYQQTEAGRDGALFNQIVQLLIRWGLLSGERIAALDGSKLPTPQSYEGCGKLKQTRKVKVKGHKEPVTQEYYVYR